MVPLATILGALTGADEEQARKLATERIAAGRAEHARLPLVEAPL